MQCHVWGVAVATVRDQEINVVASVSGRLMGPQTVYRSEARALLFVAEYQRQQVLDVTTDCQAVYKRLQRKSLKGASMDILSGLSRQENSSSLSGSTATWKRSLSRPNLVHSRNGAG